MERSYNLYIFLISIVLFSLVSAVQRDIMSYVDNRDLGRITPGPNGITELKILNAFVRANPRLPAELQVTNQANRKIHVAAQYVNRALIDTLITTQYTGHLEVTFNGGPPAAAPSSPENHGAGGNTWGSRMNISQISNLDRQLRNLANTNDRTIKQAFVSINNLPNELVDILEVRSKTNSGAKLYVPELKSGRYVGEVNVFFSR